ncbi:hypothetical protein ACHAQF_003164 [Verticillium nonalfalfae]
MAPGAEKPVLTAEEKSAKTAKSSTRYPFWFGGSASSMAACVTHPLDLGAFLSPLPFPLGAVAAAMAVVVAITPSSLAKSAS